MFNARPSRVLKSPRLICNLSGLYFSATGKWTADLVQATIFSSVGGALRARREFALDDIWLVSYPPDFGWLN